MANLKLHSLSASNKNRQVSFRDGEFLS
jgi:uncharacterized protein YdgA (DUF945 family)